MLSAVLLRHMIRSLLGVVAPFAVLTGLLFGWAHAFGLVVGAALIGTSVGGLVYIVGRITDPTEPSTRKSALSLVLMLKMAAVGAVLWLCLGRWGVSPLGILFGIALGLLASLLGVSSGAASAEGKRAMDATEARIREELGDSDEESR